MPLPFLPAGLASLLGSPDPADQKTALGSNGPPPSQSHPAHPQPEQQKQTQQQQQQHRNQQPKTEQPSGGLLSALTAHVPVPFQLLNLQKAAPTLDADVEANADADANHDALDSDSSRSPTRHTRPRPISTPVQPPIVFGFALPPPTSTIQTLRRMHRGTHKMVLQLQQLSKLPARPCTIDILAVSSRAARRLIADSFPAGTPTSPAVSSIDSGSLILAVRAVEGKCAIGAVDEPDSLASTKLLGLIISDPTTQMVRFLLVSGVTWQASRQISERGYFELKPMSPLDETRSQEMQLPSSARWVFRRSSTGSRHRKSPRHPKYVFSPISPGVRRHPVLGSVDRDGLIVKPEYRVPAPDEKGASQDHTTSSAPWSLHLLTILSGIWVARREGWPEQQPALAEIIPEGPELESRLDSRSAAIAPTLDSPPLLSSAVPSAYASPLVRKTRTSSISLDSRPLGRSRPPTVSPPARTASPLQEGTSSSNSSTFTVASPSALPDVTQSPTSNDGDRSKQRPDQQHQPHRSHRTSLHFALPSKLAASLFPDRQNGKCRHSFHGFSFRDGKRAHAEDGVDAEVMENGSSPAEPKPVRISVPAQREDAHSDRSSVTSLSASSPETPSPPSVPSPRTSTTRISSAKYAVSPPEAESTGFQPSPPEPLLTGFSNSAQLSKKEDGILSSAPSPPTHTRDTSNGSSSNTNPLYSPPLAQADVGTSASRSLDSDLRANADASGGPSGHNSLNVPKFPVRRSSIRRCINIMKRIPGVRNTGTRDHHNHHGHDGHSHGHQRPQQASAR